MDWEIFKAICEVLNLIQQLELNSGRIGVGLTSIMLHVAAQWKVQQASERRSCRVTPGSGTWRGVAGNAAFVFIL